MKNAITKCLNPIVITSISISFQCLPYINHCYVYNEHGKKKRYDLNVHMT